MKPSPRIKRKRIGLCCLFLLSFSVISCASNIRYYPQLNEYLYARDYDSACRLIKESRKDFKKRDILLYYLDEGLIAHFASRYEESNRSLSQAGSIMDKLYTRSLSREAASFVINDNTIPYRGEDFESALVNLFMSLNYAGLGLWDDALVEARKVDNKLNILNARYEENERNVYREDAFIRFLMGVLYEAQGEINDAYISYWKSQEIYRTDYLPNYGVSPPAFLIKSLLGAAQAMGFQEEMMGIQREYPDIAIERQVTKKDMAEVYFIHYNGPGPEKVEEYFLVPMPDGYIMKMAYPGFVKKSYGIRGSKILLENLSSRRSYSFDTALMEDISSIAVKNLDNRIGRIRAKAIVRMTAKYLMARAAEKAARENGGDILGLMVRAASQIISLTTEHADIRHWRLLPAEIRVGRAVIAPGEYEGKISFVTAGGTAVDSIHTPRFSITKGEKKFFTFRTLN